MKKNICVLTGTRAEYGLLKPILEEINNHPDLNLRLLVTGMHLSKEFGNTIEEIASDGFEIAKKINVDTQNDSKEAMSLAIGKGIVETTHYFKKARPDILLLLGDRVEALAVAIAAAYMNIPIAHIHGGDISRAGLDESARHAITKFAHIHFPATKKSAERIKMLGEDDWRIHVTGAPGLDSILKSPLLDRVELEKELGFSLDEKFLLLVQHAVSTEPEKAEEQILATLEAIKEEGLQTIVIYPNSDVGGRKIIEKIDEYKKTVPFLHVFKSLSHQVYLSLLSHANLMIGNSSSGVIESSSFKLPVVNIGMRQEGRETANNVLPVPHEKKRILSAMKKALSQEFIDSLKDCKSPYGDGTAAKQITHILAEIDTGEENLKKLLQKMFAE